jgi:regulator of replication initiation timing
LDKKFKEIAAEEEEVFESMQSLIAEKERLNVEQQKIRENKFLKMVDRTNAIKSVRSLSRTIDELISKEKEKISEHY